jgi:hypothetical protein
MNSASESSTIAEAHFSNLNLKKKTVEGKKERSRFKYWIDGNDSKANTL